MSRLGNPLINEVIIPLAKKDYWNSAAAGGRQAVRASTSRTRSWPGCCRSSTPVSFPNLAALDKRHARADLEAILLTGIPCWRDQGLPELHRPDAGRHAPAQHLDSAHARQLRTFSILGLIGGDLAGFPNGRRVIDDVVTIELRAIAGRSFPLIDPKYVVDAAVADVTDGLTGTSVTNQPLPVFPYMGVPYDGYHNPS